MEVQVIKPNSPKTLKRCATPPYLGEECSKRRRRIEESSENLPDSTSSKSSTPLLTLISAASFLSETDHKCIGEVRLERHFEALKCFHSKFDKFPTSRETVTSNRNVVVKIGRWCEKQRKLHKANKLCSARAEKLIKMGFTLCLKDNTYNWDRNYHALQHYLIAHNGHQPQQRCVYVYCGETIKLGYWCDNQRTAFKNGKLPDTYEEKLRDIGFSLQIRDKNDTWQKHFRALQYYLVTENSFPGWRDRMEFKGDNMRIGFWCGKQRSMYKNGKLSRERTQHLLDTGFVFEFRDTRWKTTFEALKNFMSISGEKVPGSRVVFEYCGEKIKLGRWCDKQRQSMKTGVLSSTRARMLVEIGFNSF